MSKRDEILSTTDPVQNDIAGWVKPVGPATAAWRKYAGDLDVISCGHELAKVDELISRLRARVVSLEMQIKRLGETK